MVYASNEFVSFLAVAYLTRAGHILQRRCHFMVRKLLASFTHKWHMTIGTGYASSGVNSCHINFIIGMLCFKHGSTAKGMSPVSKLQAIIIGFHCFHSKTIIPGEDKILCTICNSFVEIIFYM